MLPSNNIQSIVGATLYGHEKAKIGRIDQVLVDAAAGHPTWAVLHGGVFGRKNLFVPLEDATWEHDDVFVELDKDDVKHAPHPDAEGGLSPAEEQELRAYYAGLQGRHEHSAAAPPPAATPDATPSDHTEAALGRDDAGETDDGPKHAADADAPEVDESVVLVQERLVVRTEQVPVGRVHVDAIDDVDPPATAPDEAATPARDDPDRGPDDNRPGPDRIVI
jgi:hypothetical protein